MKVFLRLTQEIFPEKWDELNVLDKKFDEIENKFGAPPKSRARMMVDNQLTNTLIIEREFEDDKLLRDLDKNCRKDPEYKTLEKQLKTIVKSQKTEIFVLMKKMEM
jgi:hypothetical protein